MAKRYYWLKLPDDFFRQKAIKKLRKIAGGDTYTIIYLKMLLVAMKHDGKIYYDGVESTFYDELALELDEEPDHVEVTVIYLLKQGLMRLVDDTEYILEECANMTGSESASAERMRRLRDKKASLCDSTVTQPLRLSDVEKEIEKELEIEKKREEDTCAEQTPAPEPEPFITLPLNTGEEYPVFQSDIDNFAELYPAVDVPQAIRGMKGWLITNPTKRKTKRGIQRFMNSWLAREQDKGGKSGYRRQAQSKPNSFCNFSQRDTDYDSIVLEQVKSRIEKDKGEP